MLHADHEMDFGALRVAIDVFRLLGESLLDEFEIARGLLAVVVGEANRCVLGREAEPVAKELLRALDVAAELRHGAQFDDAAFLLRLVVEPSALVQGDVEAVAAAPRGLYAVALHGLAETFTGETKAVPGFLDVVEEVELHLLNSCMAVILCLTVLIAPWKAPTSPTTRHSAFVRVTAVYTIGRSRRFI